MSTEIEVTLDATEARRLTDRIRTGVDLIGDLIAQAYLGRAWELLGYQSWDDYLAEEFGSSGLLALAREDRQVAVGSLREAGLSQRAIAAATGVSQSQIDRDLKDVTLNGSPDTVIGLDGKSYPQPEPPPAPKPRWTMVERDLQRALRAGETIVVTLRGPHDNLIEWAQENGLYVRIDRRSDWGNPFVTPGDGDRDTVIANYGEHYLPYKPSLLARIDELKGKALGCWCSPEPCHGDVLKDVIDDQRDEYLKATGQ